LFSAKEPVDRPAHIVFASFAHHASHGFAILIEDDRTRHNVAKAETVQRIRISVYPTVERDMQSGQRVRNLRAVLG
jgi:hypothetical protein